MNITIESHVLNHYRRSGLMTYTEGLINSVQEADGQSRYSLLYYSLTRPADNMPGPSGKNVRKIVLKIPDQNFMGRQRLIDLVALPAFFKLNRTRIFHRTCGYTMPASNRVFRILTVHDLRTLMIGDNLWQQNIDAYKKTLHERVDVCVAVSECTKKDMVEHLGVKEKKIKVIYLSADQRFKPAPPKEVHAVRRKYQIDEPYLFSVGSVPRKNIDGIIRAYAQSKVTQKFRLVLGCNQDKYVALAKDLRIDHRTTFLSKPADGDIVALYSGCHAFVFPSLYEGFGLPILEAMQCGAPVITSNISSCPEVAGQAALLVNPAQPDEITDAINQICSDETLRQNLIVKGFQRAKCFNWSHYGKEMKKIYEQA